jgi:hypothetical protein
LRQALDREVKTETGGETNFIPLGKNVRAQERLAAVHPKGDCRRNKQEPFFSSILLDAKERFAVSSRGASSSNKGLRIRELVG